MTTDNHLKAQNIIHFVADFYDIDVDVMLSRIKPRDVSFARSVAMYVVYKKMNSVFSLKEIGKFFQRDHTTIMYAIASIGKQIEIYLSTAKEVEFVMGKFSTVRQVFIPKTEPKVVLEYIHDFSNIGEPTQSGFDYMNSKF